jgi:hypothetical protein
MHLHHLGTSWVSQGISYRRGIAPIALDSVGGAKRLRLRKEQAKGKKRAIFIVSQSVCVKINPVSSGSIQWEVKCERDEFPQ